MLVTLQSSEKLVTVSLPERVKGQYWITYENEHGKTENLLEIEGVEGAWRLKSNSNAYVCGTEGKTAYKYYPLKNYDMCKVALLKTGDSAIVFSEPDTEDRRIYNKFQLRYDKTKLQIGRGENADICFKNERVSTNHAVLVYEEGYWSITDSSLNGTYVNNIRINGTVDLAFGDVISIMGLRIIVCDGFLAMNNPDGRVTINHNILNPFAFANIHEIDEDEIEVIEEDYYYRSPRFKRGIEEKIIKVDAPPPSFVREEMPLIMVLGPSLTMGIASITTAAYSVYNAIQNGNMAAAIPSMAMSFSMLLGTVLWPILSKRYEKKRNAKKEWERIDKYQDYLKEIRQETDDEVAREREIIEENCNSAEYWKEIIESRSRKLWERTHGQDDFLNIRVGIGERDSKIKYQYQERKFTMDNDDLQKQMLDICENPPKLENVPISISLQQDYILGLVGRQKSTYQFLDGMLIQLAAQYGYDEVKFVFIMNETQEAEYMYVRRLPHVWNNEKNFRFVATNYAEVKEISNYLEQVVESRLDVRGEDIKDNMPYYIFFVLDKTLADKTEVLKQIYRQKTNINMSVVYVQDQLKKLPKECLKYIEFHNNQAKIYDKGDITGRSIAFIADLYTKGDLDEIVSQLANIELDLSNAAYNLPKMVTFLDMYGVGKIEHLNVDARWRENNPVKSLEVPIGVDTMGELFKLDLHEKFHGPHGLVAGMTGSGKSEFIMTFILSLALNYHPNEVAFVLIDYKGGGMAKAFEKLPHTAGIITNLDGAAVNRSLLSIQSELKRRQAIFAEAGKLVQESNIDIYKYQKYYREGKVQEPLQHLFIISDEFAELKTQQPEFMEQLVSAARIGRSLGVHLILATQKPAGVVDDQIWSNSKFRICLKVQDRADSMDMLKRADAASLSDTGRFYLQVGYNELFELGQSAWAGAPYIPSEKVVKKRDTAVELLDRCGNVLAIQKKQEKQMVRNPKKQLDEVTEYLSMVAKEENIFVRQLWLEPISDKIYVENLRKKYMHKEEIYQLNPIIGEYDDPMHQRQCLLTLPLTTDGNAIVYGAAGNGKTTFLTTLMYSLISSHSPEEVKIFALDFSSETLRAFAKAPHVCDVLVSGDDEKIENMFRILDKEIVNRKQKCAEHGGDYASYIQDGKKDMPNIVVVINNYAGFAEIYEDYEEYIQYQSREGIKYGIYYVLSALSTNAIRYRLQQNFRQMLVMQMNDEGEYSSVLGSTNGMVPSKHKGRGLLKMDNVYEFQTAYVDRPDNVFECIRNYSLKLLDYYGEREDSIPVLPDVVTIETFKETISLEGIPIGISKENIETQYINFRKNPVAFLTGRDYREIEKVLLGLIDVLVEINDVDISIIDGTKSLQDSQIGFNLIQRDYEKEVEELYQTILKRNNYYKDCQGVLPEGEEFEDKIVVFNNFSEIRRELSADSISRIKLAMDKNVPEYHVFIIVIDNVNDMYAYIREPWYVRYNSDNGGVFVGNGLADQYTLTITGQHPEIKQAIESGFGYVIREGKPILTKMVSSQKEAGNE